MFQQQINYKRQNISFKILKITNIFNYPPAVMRCLRDMKKHCNYNQLPGFKSVFRKLALDNCGTDAWFSEHECWFLFFSLFIYFWFYCFICCMFVYFHGNSLGLLSRYRISFGNLITTYINWYIINNCGLYC